MCVIVYNSLTLIITELIYIRNIIGVFHLELMKFKVGSQQLLINKLIVLTVAEHYEVLLIVSSGGLDNLDF